MKKLLVAIIAAILILGAYVTFTSSAADASTGYNGFQCASTQPYTRAWALPEINISNDFNGIITYYNDGYRCKRADGSIQSWHITKSYYDIQVTKGGIYANFGGGAVQNVHVDATSFGSPVINTPEWIWNPGYGDEFPNGYIIGSQEWSENANAQHGELFYINVQISLADRSDYHLTWSAQYPT